MPLGKLRPVGSRVPRPDRSARTGQWPWSERYDTEFTNSGTAALSWAVAAVKADKPDIAQPEVIIPAYACPDLIAAVIAQDVKPVLVDFDRERPRFNQDALEQAFTSATIAVVAVDFLGLAEDLCGLERLCKRNGISLIEDSAQKFPPASAKTGEADYIVLSFGRGKPINLMGGGALLSRTGICSHASDIAGSYPQDEQQLDIRWQIKRWIFNALLSRFAFGLLARLPWLNIGQTVFHPLESISRRHMNNGLVVAGIRQFDSRPLVHEWYERALATMDMPGWSVLGAEPHYSSEESAPRLRFALLAPNRSIRDQTLAELNREGIGANAFYERPLPDISGVAELLNVQSSDFPEASSFADRLVTLPTHDDVTVDDVKTILRVIERHL